MKLPHRRRFLHLVASAAALPAVPRVARAQAYPARPVRLIVGFAPGGPADIIARLMGQFLSERLGQQFIIENRPGAGSNIAAEAAVRAPPDGYTLLLVTSTSAINATLYDKLNFDLVRDIAPVASINRSPGVMEVNLMLPVKSVPEFIAYAKANPGKISNASAGPGSASHVFSELFKAMTGVDLVQVHYRGSGPAFPDLFSGQVHVMFDILSSSIGHIRAGKLRPLAVTTATRAAALPEVPTVGEFVPGYEASGWAGIGAPKNTPAEIIQRLNREINAILADPKAIARITDLGIAVFASTPAEFRKHIADETEKWSKVVRAANIKPE
jgi:tripartite-type tricarboxylate transporter receptor subunit TctC